MKLTFLASGSRGDVQPFVALAYSALQAGHDVRFVTNAVFADWVRTYGIEVSPIGWEPTEGIRVQLALDGLRGRKWLAGIQQVAETSARIYHQAQGESLQACQGAERLVYSFLSPWGLSIAEKLGIPAICGTLHPITPTRQFPMQVLTGNYGKTLNSWSHAASVALLWLVIGGYTNRFRREIGLPPIRSPRPFQELVNPRQAPLLCNLSPSVIPRPPDWPANIHMYGYWYLPVSTTWQPPGNLVNFIERGAPPVYIGFGSMIVRDPEKVAEMVLKALRLTGLRGVLAAGWGGLAGVEPSQDVFWLHDAPHDWLFPQMAAVVHHGGAGTTAAGLKAGVPSVVVPFMQDQPFWADRLHRLGVSPLPLPRKQLNAEALAERLTQATNDPALRERARQIAGQIAAERGLEQSIRVIESHWHDPSASPTPINAAR
jgi:UDP:flavonoid glycosyltransferase YjiC (YdhE family)